MKWDMWDEKEAKQRCAALWSDDLILFPSKESQAFQEFKEDFHGRHEYISRIGFVLFNSEFVQELSEEFRKRGIETFIETGSGYGTFTTILNNNGFHGKGYTLRLPEDPNEHHWGLTLNPIYSESVKNGTTVLKDLREIHDDPETDMIVSGWVPLGGGQEVQNYFDNNYYPKWYLVVGEYGGCTGSDEYHEWLQEHYMVDHRFNTYESFDMIHDSAILYKRKEN